MPKIVPKLFICNRFSSKVSYSSDLIPRLYQVYPKCWVQFCIVDGLNYDQFYIQISINFYMRGYLGSILFNRGTQLDKCDILGLIGYIWIVGWLFFSVINVYFLHLLSCYMCNLNSMVRLFAFSLLLVGIAFSLVEVVISHIFHHQDFILFNLPFLFVQMKFVAWMQISLSVIAGECLLTRRMQHHQIWFLPWMKCFWWLVSSWHIWLGLCHRGRILILWVTTQRKTWVHHLLCLMVGKSKLPQFNQVHVVCRLGCWNAANHELMCFQSSWTRHIT